MKKITTIDVYNPHNPARCLRINEADFNPAEHVPWRKGGSPENEREAKLLALYAERADKVFAQSEDPKDKEIKRLRAELQSKGPTPKDLVDAQAEIKRLRAELEKHVTPPAKQGRKAKEEAKAPEAKPQELIEATDIDPLAGLAGAPKSSE